MFSIKINKYNIDKFINKEFKKVKIFVILFLNPNYDSITKYRS